MGRHRPSSTDTPLTLADILNRPPEILEDPATEFIFDVIETDTGSFRVWATPYLAAGMVGASMLTVVSSDTPAAEAGTIPPVNTGTMRVADALHLADAGVHKITDEEAAERLSLLAASRVAREDQERAAQAVQDAADQAEIDRQAAEAAETARLAEEHEEEMARQAAEAAQERLEGPGGTSDTTETVSGGSSNSPVGASGVIVPGARLTSGFGQRWGTLHAGIDLAAPLGTPIYSPVSGRVLLAGPASGFGHWVVIIDNAGDAWVFGHMTGSSIRVSVGESVSEGEQIASVGNEGQSTGPHCHIERHIGGLNGTKVDPTSRLQALGYL